MDTKNEELMKLIDSAAQEELVKADKNLYSSMVQAYKDLSNNKDIKITGVKLNGVLSRYLLTHEYKAPKTVIDLAQELQKYDANRWGHVNPINLG